MHGMRIFGNVIKHMCNNQIIIDTERKIECGCERHNVYVKRAIKSWTSNVNILAADKEH